MIWLYAIVSVLIVSLISLIGVFALALNQKFLNKILLFLVAFSAGGLLGDAFIHLLPESIATSGLTLFVSLSIFSGIIVFFILEKFLRWRHCHDVDCSTHVHHLGPINLISDGVHNLIDGLLIGASFLISIPLGITTTLAVIMHEIPHELGNFSVLLHSGYTIKKAIIYNFISALAAVIGVILVLLIGEKMVVFRDFMIPFTVGTFMYIALSDLIPELHKEVSWKKSLIQLVSFVLGIGLMLLLLLNG
jgi:zinc and cadmium transporter